MVLNIFNLVVCLYSVYKKITIKQSNKYLDLFCKPYFATTGPPTQAHIIIKRISTALTHHIINYKAPKQQV